MAEDPRTLASRHQAFYEVAPYYVVLAETTGSTLQTKREMAGYDVEIFGVRTDEEAPFMPPAREYAIGYGALRNIVTQVSQDAAGSCSVELFPLPGTVVFGPRGHAGQAAAVFRIRICRREVDEPAGSSEAQVLAELERQLEELGLAHR